MNYFLEELSWHPLLWLIPALAGIALYVIWHQGHRLRKAEKLLTAAKHETMQMAQLSLNTPYPVVHLVPGKSVLLANPAAHKAFGDIHSEHMFFKNLEAFAEREGREWEGRSFEYTAIPMNFDGQKSLMVYAYDIDDLKKTQKALEASRVQAEAASQAKSDFLANMSHELRTPMNGIIGLADILSESQISTPHAELAHTIQSSAKGLLILLNDILDFSKIEAGELRMESIAFSPAALAEQSIVIQRTVAEKKHLDLSCSVSDTVPLRLLGDPVRVQQIVHNLLSNALKFTDLGSVTLKFSGESRTDNLFMLHIEVRDSGIGIPLSQQKHIFTKFTQADLSTTRKYGGTGLGLSITQQLTQLMGGRIEVESAEGRGSTFHVFLPLPVAAEAPKAVHEARAVKHLPKLSGSVLLVDDHPVNLLFMRSLLERLGIHDFDQASNGRDAVLLAAKREYDLILMDCQMPDMDGLQATKAIRKSGGPSRESPIIALTADAMRGAAEKCLAAGMNDYVSKPIEKERLIAIMTSYLKSSPQPQAESVFDPSRLREFTENDASLTQKILDTFLEQAQEDISHIIHLYEAQSFKSWESAVHKLYGSCANIGASALAEICNRIHSPHTPEDIHDIQNRIVEQYERLTAHLREWKAAA